MRVFYEFVMTENINASQKAKSFFIYSETLKFYVWLAPHQGPVADFSYFRSSKKYFVVIRKYVRDTPSVFKSQEKSIGNERFRPDHQALRISAHNFEKQKS